MIPLWQKATRNCKMATLDDSPSLFAGQTWSSWLTDVPLSPESDSGDENGNRNADVDSDSMKLCKEDMGLFGQCPSQDEFYLVMCEKCDKVIKPKAFKRHLKQRHGESGLPTTIQLSQRLSCPKSKLSVSPNYKPTKASVKEMPPAISNAQKSGTGINNKLSGLEKGKCNHHTEPFVKMERVELNKYPSHHIESAVNINKPPPLMNGTHNNINSVGGGSSSSSSSSRLSSKNSNGTPTPPTPTTPVSLTIPSFSTSSSVVSVVCSSLTTTTPTTCLYTTMTTTTAPTMTPVVTPSSAPNLAAAILGISPGNCTSVVKSRSSGGNISSSNHLNSSSSGSSLQGSSNTPHITTPHVTPPSSKKKAARSDRPDKLIPCKDREYDCNKHCGVTVEETDKPCTRSLTCKTHALSLRRKVTGRRKPFDDLLKEHRAIKEAFLKQKAEQKAAQQALTSGGSQTKPPMPHGASPLVPLLAAASKNNQSHNALLSANSQSSRDAHHGSTHKSWSRSPQKHNNILARRSGGLSSLHSPPHQSVLKDDTGSSLPQPQPPDGHLSDMEGDDDEDDKTDRSYLTYHPRPAATCTFGARHHSYNGRGCYMFNRRVDILRAAFLNVLEKHLNPPPPKKLCVESNLPKEPQFLSNSKDPYEFNLVDTNSAGATQHLSAVLNSSSNKNTVKPKSKISSGRSKSKDGSCGGSRSPSHSSNSTPVVTGAVKRKRSGSGNAVATSPTSYSTVSSGFGTATTIISSIASLNTHNTNSPLTAIAIPSVNLSNTTLSHFNANLSGGQGKNPKNNLLKDIGLVVRGTDLSSFVNGQYVIGGAQLLDEKILQPAHVVSGNKSNPKLVNNMEALPKGNLIPTNAIFVDSAMQPGTTLLAPVSVGSVPSNTVISLANSSVAQQPQASPSTAPSPLFRSGSVSPQVSSPLPNGLVQSSPSEKGTNSHRHALLHHKGPQRHAQPGVSQPGLLSASQVINVSSSNPNHVFTQLAQLQVKPGMAKSGANKVTVQPVSLTFPITNLGAVSGQTPTHTLFITSSEESQRHDLQQVSSSPSSLMS